MPQGDTAFYWTVGILMYHGHGLLVNLSMVTRGKSISDRHHNLTFYLKNHQKPFLGETLSHINPSWESSFQPFPRLGINQRLAHPATKASLMVFASPQEILRTDSNSGASQAAHQQMMRKLYFPFISDT